MDKKQKVTGNRRFLKPVIVVAVILLAGIIAGYFLSDSNSSNDQVNNDINPYQNPATAADVATGAILAHQYCQSCHLFPEPALLNKNKWKNILPQMGIRLGIKTHRGESYQESIKSTELVVPASPVITDSQWQQIIDYYMVTAPIFLPVQQRSVPITRKMPFFSVHEPAPNFSGKQVLATYVKIDTSVKPARILVANGQSNKLFLLNNKLKVIDSVTTTGPVVDISFTPHEILVCMIGKELGANDDKAGSIAQLHISSTGKMNLDAAPVFKNLARPVQILPVDLNGDQKTDYLICEFGNLTGALSWMENKGNGTFTRHVISNLPGAIKAYIDYSANSKLPNIWVLFTQGQERISYLTNKGNGVFEEKPVLKFPPIYGSSFFELVDINHDGYKDIIYTCGDNGNATLVLKPYHGVYVFLNNGHNQFRQKYFYPINGCYKAYARDFDGDGNIDIATVSLYTDAHQPEEGFVYLKNTGGLNFTPYSLTADTKFERAVTLDEGDVNGDGKPDLLIGNAYFDFGPFGYQIKEPLFYLLKNITR
ncbi:FG-GAP repeat domain-containing protein [Mucilaginibacter sp. SP1R1]|uniref:FG-GAP repeat domain-containing protein n=1 Tax=Mucilaginibacter sp. SP1R1 TaxID=2723091 RepID=UPI00161AF342|nr:VCBS repeat-containing protein [Mucilaginibacter sp. SP1R1]MBB6147663.1 hypothetical protein [Mucilaginibacter sp. SP1R1]